MESRWSIKKKDGSKVGPYLSSEVRDLIRKGEVDLYDWVYKEDSKFTLRLIDTDEIFTLSSKVKDSIYKITEDPLNEIPFEENAPEKGSTKLNKTALKKLESSKVEDDSNSPLNKKIYYITTDRKKFVGPVSANTIVSKYKAKKAKKLIIKQDGSDVLIKIDLFVKTILDYKDSSSQNIMLNNLFKKKKSSKRLQEIKDSLTSESSTTSNLSYYKIFGIALISIALIVAGIFIYPIFFSSNLAKKSVIPAEKMYEDKTNSLGSSSTTPNTQQNTYYNFEEENVIPMDTIQIQANATTTISPNNSTTKSKSNSISNTANKNVKKPNITSYPKTNPYSKNTTYNNIKFYQPNTKLAKNTSIKQPTTSNLQANKKTKKPINHSNVSKSKPKTKSVSKAKPQQNLKPTVTPTKQKPTLLANNKNLSMPVASSSKQPSSNPNQLTVGSVATLYNMKFSKAELSLCSGKCDLEFYNNKLSVRGIFFKGAYVSTLSKKNTVTITGTVSKKGSSYSMFIQNIE